MTIFNELAVGDIFEIVSPMLYCKVSDTDCIADANERLMTVKPSMEVRLVPEWLTSFDLE